MGFEPFYYQCDKTDKCTNTRCFWKMRDCFGLEPFPVYMVDGKYPAIEKNYKIEEEFGPSYFPEHKVSVGTNAMYIVCKDYKE